MDRIAAFLLSFVNPTYQVERILGSFTRMVEKLDDAIAKINKSISDSHDRVDSAYIAFINLEETERVLRSDLKDSRGQAQRARQKIAEIVGA
jgi:hypothetical protein